MATVVTTPGDGGAPGMLVQLLMERRVSGAGDDRVEAAQTRRRTTSAFRRPNDVHPQAEDRRIFAAVENVDAGTGAAQGRAQVVRDAHGRGQEDHTLDVIHRQPFSGSKDDRAAGAVADQVDTAAGV